MLYELVAEDLTHLGGPMGSEYTTQKSLGLFSGSDAIEKAKEVAVANYNRRNKIIKWRKENDSYHSQDLGFVMYHIIKRKVN